MSTLIPNESCFISFAPDMPASPTLVPTEEELADSVELTDFIISLTANSTGNTVPTPKLSSLFEPSIPGTSTAQFTAEMYRDSIKAEDIAWNTLPRNTSGVFYISRFGGTGTNLQPVAGDEVEVWPVRVTSRSASAMSSNTAQTFTLTCSVPQEPNEAAVIGGGTPPAPKPPTGATAGTPGSFTPAGSDAPTTITGLTASPTTKWTQGQFVTVAGGDHYWDGSAWATGKAPAPAPVPATGATSGKPGTFTPAGSTPPADAAAAETANLTASPSSAWNTDEYVQGATSGNAGQMHYDGSAWVSGKAT